MASTAIASNDRFLTNAEAATWLKLSPRTLEKQRVLGGGPPFRKFGRRVLYAVADLEAWSAERTCVSTSAPNYPVRRACAVPAESAPAPSARFRALPGDFAPRDTQDLMTWPLFYFSNSRRTEPLDFPSCAVPVRVECRAQHGYAPNWEAPL